MPGVRAAQPPPQHPFKPYKETYTDFSRDLLAEYPVHHTYSRLWFGDGLVQDQPQAIRWASPTHMGRFWGREPGSPPKIQLRQLAKANMPGKTKATKGNTGTAMKSKRSRRGRLGKLGRQYVPFGGPASMKVVVAFSGQFSTTETAAGAGAYKFFRMNSAYDVDTGVGSNAVVGFAEAQNIYANYRVLRTRIEVVGTCGGGTSGAACTVGIIPQAYTATLPTSVTAAFVQPYSVVDTVTQSANGGHNRFRLLKTYHLPTLLHITTAQFTDEQNYSANIASNPATQVYWAFALLGIGASSVFVAAYQVYQTMEVEFFNPVTVSI